jgi:eukaryotic-like serine/threonine-protein kinase
VTEEQQQRVVAGRYTVIRELGRGGMGVVWLAEDATIGRRVAVKELLLPAGIPANERHVFEERVLREARTAGRLSDPGIVTVHDVVQEDGATFIVMELIEAPNLSDVIKDHGVMPPDRVLRIAEQVLTALQTAHAAGVVHRDVKPSNVMVGANGRVKLTDFGIAQSTEDSRLTTSGMLVGSPTYISPERLLGQDASPASDLWALGATLFFAAEGYGAYDRQTTAASIQAIMNERAQLRMVPHGPLAELILGLLNPAPEARLNAAQAHYLIEQARAQRPPTGPQQVFQPPSGPQQVLQPPSGPQPVFQPPSGPQPVFQPPHGGTHVLPSPAKGRKGILLATGAVVLVGAVVAVLALTGVFDSKKSSDSASSMAPAGSAGAATKKSNSGGSAGSASASGSSGSGATRAETRALTYGPGGEITSQQFIDNADTGCFTGETTDARPVDCAKPHVIEVFGKVNLEIDYDSYPAVDAMTQTVTDACRKNFDDLPPPKVQVSMGVVLPTKDAWAADKREGLCAVYAPGNSEMTGSVADN